MLETPNSIVVTVVDRPARKLLLIRGIKATDYFKFCEEVGCDTWGILTRIREALYEPVGMWMPDNLRLEGTSVYTQGVEVPLDYSGEVPEGFEVIELPECKMMMFQGPPYENDQFMEAIVELQKQIAVVDPENYGCEWADEIAPKIQLEPKGSRGYIEGRPVRDIGKKA